MTVTFTDAGVGTMACDRCPATWTDGIAEHEHNGQGLIHRRAHETAGWKSHRPNEYRQEDLCPDCDAKCRHPRGTYCH